jgi:L-fucose mutarotase/ribose pyranase (RbsD/FucU family)
VLGGNSIHLGMPVVVAVPEGTHQDTVPIVLRDFPVAALTAGKLAQVRLVKILEAVASSLKVDSSAPERVNASPSVTGHDLESRVAAVFQQSGARIARQFAVTERRLADLAAWDNTILTPAFNPIIIEVKSSFSHTTVDSGLAQVESYLAELGLLLGLLVVSQAPPPRWHVNNTLGHAVGVIGISDLEAMDTEALRRFLAAGRNQLVHGVM